MGRSGFRPLLVLSLTWAASVWAACATGDLAPDGGDGDGDAAVPTTPDAAQPGDAALSPGLDAAATFDAGAGAADSAPAPDAAPPADAPPCTPTWIELLADGSFDDGAAAWSVSGGTVVYPSAGMPISAHTADRAVWLVGYNNADEEIHQAVTVPADTTALRLRGYACYVTADLAGVDDFLSITLRAPGGAPLETLASYSNADVAEVCGWEAFVLDAASAHAGEVVQLHLRGTSDGSYVTSFFVDSLHLEAHACP